MLRLVDDDLIVNPYSKAESQLLTLDTGEYMDPEISKGLASLETVGNDLYETYIKERIDECTKAISDVIKKTKNLHFHE